MIEEMENGWVVVLGEDGCVEWVVIHGDGL